MPLMKRVKGKAAEIAFDIIGTPANMVKKGSRKKKKKREKELNYQNTSRIR